MLFNFLDNERNILMRQFLLNYVKTNNLVYDLYYYLGSFFIRLLGVFAKTDEKYILFVSFGGKRFDDSPKVVYDQMIKLEQFKDFKYYWAFVNTSDYDIPKGEKIKIDTLKYFWIAQKSKVWITNSAIERGLKFKKDKTFYVNTWHGTPLKKIGKDENAALKTSGLGSKDICTQDIILAQSNYDAEIFSNVFNVDISKIIVCDLPRNDELSSVSISKKEIIKKKLNIDNNKQIILYAPTYREFERDNKNNCCLKPPINFKEWKNKLGNDSVILFRSHYEVAKVLGIEESEFIKNVSDYDNLNELMIVSDMLISDYSSIFFDYSILEKPMFCFAYDYEEYKEKRGLYLDLKTELPCVVHRSEDSLLEDVINNNYSQSIEKVKEFKAKYAPNSGKSTDIVIKIIEERLGYEKSNNIWNI